MPVVKKLQFIGGRKRRVHGQQGQKDNHSSAGDGHFQHDFALRLVGHLTNVTLMAGRHGSRSDLVPARAAA
jgi:hypothetical protein